MTAESVGVVICGMGRSGTSAVTGLFASSGYHVARDEDRMPANSANPVGYHENLRVWRLNERLLADMDATWFAPPPEDRQIAARARFGPEIEREFAALLAEAGPAPVALKDPRIDVMAPLWAPVVGNCLHPVVVIRDPVEIAGSLAHRDGTPVPFALASWEIHMAAVLRWLRGREVTVARYENLLGSPAAARAVVADAGRHLEPARADTVRIGDPGSWLDTGLRHNRARPADHMELLTVRQARLWEWLDALKSGPERLSPPDQLTVASASAHAAVAHEQQRTGLAQDALVKDRELSAQSTRLAELETRLTLAERERAHLSEALEEQQAQAASAAAEERSAREELAVILQSRSWRLTSPARSAARLAKPRTRH